MPDFVIFARGKCDQGKDSTHLTTLLEIATAQGAGSQSSFSAEARQGSKIESNHMKEHKRHRVYIEQYPTWQVKSGGLQLTPFELVHDGDMVLGSFDNSSLT